MLSECNTNNHHGHKSASKIHTLQPSSTPSRSPIYLKSAFHPPTIYTRNPPLVCYSFIHTIADLQEDGVVTFSTSEVDENIKVVQDWEKDETNFLVAE